MKYRLILFFSLICLLILFWVTLPSKKVKVVFCDVGQGDAALMIYKDWQMLIDTGNKDKKVLSCLEKYMPFWDKKLELVMITHGDSDHTGGLADVSKYYTVEQLITSKNLKQFDFIKTDWMSYEVVNPREKIENNEDNNQNSIAGVWSYSNPPSSRSGGTSEGQIKKIFMAADIDLETEQRLVWQTVLRQGSGTVNILKVSHHGSKNGTSEELLDVLKPKMAIISVGAKNRFSHPNKEVLDRLKTKEVEIRRTDKEGDIVLYN